MDLGAISARLTLNINEFSSNLRRVEEEIKNTERQFSGFSDIGGRFENLGQKLTLGVTVPIVGIGIAASKASMDFEAQMSRVSAISGATGEDLRKLNDQAMQLGADTAFSSKQAAEGMENLASAGFNVTEIMQAMPGMLDLAASGGVEIAQASDIAASALRGFGLEANQAGHVADVIAKAAADTNAGVIDMGEAMKYVAPIAHSMGISLEETSAAIGLMSNAGIQGSQSGTTLRSALTRLANPSKEAAGTMKELGFNAFDSNGKMKSLSEIIGQLSDKTKNLTQEQKQQAIAEIFGQEAMSGMLVLMGEGKDKVSELTTNFKNSDGAAKEMAQTMQDNVKGAIDQMGGSLETAGIKIGNVLAPMIRNAANTVTELTNKFSQLSPETQESIVKFGLLAASVGPVVMIFGKLFSSVTAIAGGIKTVSSLFGTAKIATAAVGTAASTAAPAVAGVGTAFAGALVPLLPWVAGIGLGTVAIVKLVNHFRKDAIPEVKLFGKETSKATKEAVSGYMSLDDKATKSLMNLNYRSEKVSKETATTLTKTFNDMGSKIKDGLDKHYKESEKTMENFFKNSKALNDKEEKETLKNMQTNNEAKKKEIDSYTKEINSILEKASKDGRKLREDEVKQIETLQQKMKENAVKALSETELESKAILERMKAQHGDLTAQQAAEVVRNSNDQKEKAIKAANDQYNETVKAIIKQRDETKSISSDQANKLIADATRQRDEAVKKASDMHNQVVSHAKAQAKGHVTEVNWETGQVLSKFDSMMAKIREFNKLSIKEKVITITEKINRAFENTTPVSNPLNHYASGTDSHPGGLAVAGEEGEELTIGPDGQIGLTADTATLYNLPKGTRVVPHDKTKSFLSSLNVPGYKDGVGISNDEKKQGLIDQIENRFDLQYSNLELAMIKLGVNTRTFTEEVKKQQSEIDILNKKLSLMKSEYNEIVKVAGANSDEAISLRNNIAFLTVEIANSTQELKDKISKNAEEAKEKVISETNDLVERVKSALQEKYQDEERKQEESLQKQLDNLDTWKENSISKIEKVFDKKLERLEEDKDLSEKAFEEESNQLDKWKETSIRNIEEVANTKIKSLQAQINALDEQAKADERAEADKEELTKIQRLKDKIEFEHNEFNKAELQKELNNVIAERNKRLQQQEIEDKKETLSKQIDAVREDAEEQKQSIEDIYSVRKEELEKRIKDSEEYFARQKELIEKNRKEQQEAIEKTYTFQKGIIEKQQADWKAFYDKKLQDATLQAEAEKLVMDNNQKEIVELLHTYEAEYLAVGQSLGEKLVEGFTPKIQAIKDMISSINAEISAARSNAISAMATASQASSVISAASSGSPTSTTTNSTTNSIVNNVVFNTPQGLTPSEMLRKTETTLRNLAFSLG